MKKGLLSGAVWGVQWSTISMIATSIMQLVYTSIMARLLQPEVFGIMAIAQIILQFGTYFSKLGMGQALIQKEKISKIDIRAVFTSSIILSLVFCSLMWILAPIIGDFFKNSSDELIQVVRIMSLSFLVTGFSITSQSLILRKGEFKLLSKIEIVSFIAFLIVGITLGVLDYGVWSLVFAFLSQSILKVILSYFFTRHNLVPVFKWKYHKPFYSYGTVLSLTSFVEFFGNNIVQILIGRIYGDFKLGIYRQANHILHLPLTKLSRSINNVFFPLMSKIQNDKEKLKKSYLASVEVMSNILFPICLGISAASEEVVGILLGENFKESAPILGILSLGLGFQFLTPYAGTILSATARLNKKFFIQLLYTILMVASIYIFKNYELTTLAWIVTIGIFIRNVAYSRLVGNLLSISFKENFNSLFPSIIKGILTYAIIFAVTWGMNQLDFPLLIKGAIQAIVGSIVIIYHVFINPLSSVGRVWRDLVIKYPIMESKSSKLLFYCNWYKRQEKII